MKISRFSVGRWMVVVVVVALNLAVGQQLAAFDERLLTGVLLIAIVLQAALIGLIRTRGRKRAFWAGFVAAGSLAMLSFVLANRSAAGASLLVLNLAPGSIRIVVDPVAFRGEWMEGIWLTYRDFVKDRFPNQFRSGAVRAVVYLIPQILAGLLGGHAGWLVKRVDEWVRKGGIQDTPSP